jgi:hypothetical protein
MSERELERALADLGAHLDYPATPDLAVAVAARVEAAPAGRLWPRPRRWGLLTGWRRLAVAGLAVLLAAAVVLAASPATRQAVARRLGLRGVSVRLGGPAPTTTPPERLDLGLGRRVSLAQARAAVAFPVLVPAAPGFQRPDAVFVATAPAGGRVTLVWRARAGLPASPFTDAGLLLTEFRGELDPFFIKKVLGGGQIRAVTVAGEPGYWLSGGPHSVTYRVPGGGELDEQTRLAGNTLIWQRGDLTLRLEGQVSRGEALRIAGSLR